MESVLKSHTCSSVLLETLLHFPNRGLSRKRPVDTFVRHELELFPGRRPLTTRDARGLLLEKLRRNSFKKFRFVIFATRVTVETEGVWALRTIFESVLWNAPYGTFALVWHLERTQRIASQISEP